MGYSWIKYFKYIEVIYSELAIGLLLKLGKTWLVLWKVPIIKPRLYPLAFNWTHTARGEMSGNV